MSTEKPKKKRSPRRRHLLRFGILSGLLMFLIIGVALPPIERALVAWLADAPFTPVCQAEHLEVAIMRGGEEDAQFMGAGTESIFLYRMRLNGEDPIQVSDLNDPYATSLRWTPDGRYLVYRMTNASSGYLHFLSAHDNTTQSVEIPDPQFNWYIMPDSTAVIIWMGYSSTMYDAKFQVALPLTDETEAEPISTLPPELFSQDFPVPKLGGYQATDQIAAPYYRRFNPNESAPMTDYVVKTVKTADRAGVNLSKHIVVYEAGKHGAIWEIRNDTEGYDVEHVLQDMSSDNDLLFYRRYIPISTNSVDPAMPYEVYIADLDTQEIYPILFHRPLNYIRDLTWIPNRDLMYLALENWETHEIEVYLGDYDGSNRTLVTAVPFDNYTIGGFHVTPDGQYLSYVDINNDWLYLFDLESRQKCRVVKGRIDDWSTRYDWRLVEG